MIRVEVNGAVVDVDSALKVTIQLHGQTITRPAEREDVLVRVVQDLTVLVANLERDRVRLQESG